MRPACFVTTASALRRHSAILSQKMRKSSKRTSPLSSSAPTRRNLISGLGTVQTTPQDDRDRKNQFPASYHARRGKTSTAACFLMPAIKRRPNSEPSGHRFPGQTPLKAGHQDANGSTTVSIDFRLLTAQR